jgi:hypothetical protein
MMKGSFQDNLKVPNQRKLFKHLRERKLKPSVGMEEFAKEEVMGIVTEEPEFEMLRGYHNSSHASYKVNLIITLRSLWRLCIDLASTCRYCMPFKYLHILVTLKTYLQINMR